MVMTYDFDTTELAMVTAAREVLLREGTPDEIAANDRLIVKYTRVRPATMVTDDQRTPPRANPRPYDSTVSTAVLGTPDDRPGDGFDTPIVPRRNTVTATDKQMWLANKLMGELQTHNPDAHAALDGTLMRMADMPIGDASAFITSIREALAGPAGAPVTTPAPDRKANVWAEWRELAEHLMSFGGSTGARFAVDTDDDAVNSVAFWWVTSSDHPQYGRRFWLRQVIGGQGAVRVRLTPEAMIRIGTKIMNHGPWESDGGTFTGPEAALRRYGQLLGSCGHCGRELTNDVSRAIGIGPWCRSHRG